MKWTREREDLLVSLASLGATEIARAIHRETGVIVSVSAVAAKAHRMGISLRKAYVCTGCGGTFREVYPDGLCVKCHYRGLTERHYDETTSAELIQAKREYDLARKRKSLKKQSV